MWDAVGAHLVGIGLLRLRELYRADTETQLMWLYRFRIRRTGFELRLVWVGEVRHDRGLCLSVCCI